MDGRDFVKSVSVGTHREVLSRDYRRNKTESVLFRNEWNGRSQDTGGSNRI